MPTIEQFYPEKIGPKPWGVELLVAHTPHYTGKVLYMNAGGTGALQYHEQKDETFYLFSGEALVQYYDEDGTNNYVQMMPGEAYHVPPGAIHRVEALTDCVFFEASTPHFDDRVKVEG
jgi:mannose-6-phosphate isomerase-like protein (cupin superfamily)